MNKKDQLKKQADDLLKKVRELEIQEQQKIGKLVMELYDKNEIGDPVLRKEVAKILGDSSELGLSKAVKVNLEVQNNE